MTGKNIFASNRKKTNLSWRRKIWNFAATASFECSVEISIFIGKKTDGFGRGKFYKKLSKKKRADLYELKRFVLGLRANRFQSKIIRRESVTEMAVQRGIRPFGDFDENWRYTILVMWIRKFYHRAFEFILDVEQTDQTGVFWLENSIMNIWSGQKQKAENGKANIFSKIKRTYLNLPECAILSNFARISFYARQVCSIWWMKAQNWR